MPTSIHEYISVIYNEDAHIDDKLRSIVQAINLLRDTASEIESKFVAGTVKSRNLPTIGSIVIVKEPKPTAVPVIALVDAYQFTNSSRAAYGIAHFRQDVAEYSIDVSVYRYAPYPAYDKPDKVYWKMFTHIFNSRNPSFQNDPDYFRLATEDEITNAPIEFKEFVAIKLNNAL